MQGDPRNMALIAHWDGFQTARTTYQNTWTVEIMILNAGRNCSLTPLPVLFIPSSCKKIVKQKRYELLNYFLEPFIRDLQTLFLEGVLTTYAYPPSLISQWLSNEQFTLRAMLMMFTGDHPAQCKIGGFKDGGYFACRRDHMEWKWHKMPQQGGAGGIVHYYNNRKQSRYPAEKRTVRRTYEAALQLRIASNARDRDRYSREGGISSYSRLWRLYELYGFDLSRDLVYDVMHILPLCIFKKYIESFAKSLVPTNQKPARQKFELALKEATKSRPLAMEGRWPKDPIQRSGYLRAEEHVRFILWCLPHILTSLNLDSSTEKGMLGMLLIEIGRIFYLHSRTHGWTVESMAQARQLLMAWRVRNEEINGPNSSPLEHVVGELLTFNSLPCVL